MLASGRSIGQLDMRSDEGEVEVIADVRTWGMDGENERVEMVCGMRESGSEDVEE